MTCEQDFPNTAGFYSKIFKKHFHISRERKEKGEKEKTTSTLLSNVAAAVFAQRQRQSWAWANMSGFHVKQLLTHRSCSAWTSSRLDLSLFQAQTTSLPPLLEAAAPFLSAFHSSPGQTLIMVNCVQSGWLLCCPEWGCSLSCCLKQVREPFSSNQQRDEEAKSWIRTKYCRQRRETGQQLRKPTTLPGSTAVG